MSPQFVDFDADGKLDIVAGTFDGSPHVAYGTDKGWRQPEQILDRNGERIVLNQFWNFDTKQWDSTKRCDAEGHELGEGHLTSAVAFDWEGDGVLDLLLGDHKTGHVYLRRNGGSAQKPAFAEKNEAVLAAGAPIDVPGTVATLRLVDWNRDGLLDLAVGSMGDAYGEGPGGGVFVFVNTGSKTATRYGAPLVLLPASPKGAAEATRPDSGLYMDFADVDGDGDLDLAVGGYAHWTPPPLPLTVEQAQRVAVLREQIAALDASSEMLLEAIEAATRGLDEQAAEEKREALYAEKREELSALGKQRSALQKELDELAPGPKRAPFVWLYENRGKLDAR